MNYLYRSTTGSAVNVGSYVVSSSGAQHSEKVAELDALVGSTLTREELDYSVKVTEPAVHVDTPTVEKVLGVMPSKTAKSVKMTK